MTHDTTATEAAPVLLTTKEIAKTLRCSIRTVANLIKRGDLKGFRVGYDFRVAADVLAEFIASGGSKRD